ncbi:MAG: hypothetical protein AAFV49_02305 [Pseudomonadota bacterium]
MRRDDGSLKLNIKLRLPAWRNRPAAEEEEIGAVTVIPFDQSRPVRRHRDALEEEASQLRDRVAMLERTLMMTLRENARNWARAERAEALLAEAEADGDAERAAPRPAPSRAPDPVNLAHDPSLPVLPLPFQERFAPRGMSAPFDPPEPPLAG